MEKKEIVTFRPSATIYVLLFIFYAIWILQAFGIIGFHVTFGFDDLQEYGMKEWLIIPLACVGGFFCFYSVIKILRGDKDCITALKWALMYSFLYTFFNTQRAQIPTNNILYFSIIFLVRPLFYLFFYLYLCFSKGIKRRYPKSERHFFPSGWIWTAITIYLIGFIGYFGYETYQTYQFCKRVSLENLVLSDGEISDGYIAFKSNKNWIASTVGLDTIYIGDDKVACEQTMETTDSICSIILFSGRSEKQDIRTHNQILTKLLAVMDKDILEQSFCDTIVNDKHLIFTSFITKPELKSKTFTVATIFDTNSPKCAVFTSKFKGADNQEWLMEILLSIHWNLQSIAYGKYQKDSDDYKKDITYRTGNNEKQTDADMFASFLNGCTPSLLFGEVLLEHHKREITYSQSYNPFY